jgi:hypothetical protein
MIEFKTRLCGNLGRHNQKTGLGTSCPGKITPKVSVLEAQSSRRWHDSIISHEFVNQKVRQKDFFKNFGIPNPQNPEPSL